MDNQISLLSSLILLHFLIGEKAYSKKILFNKTKTTLSLPIKTSTNLVDFPVPYILFSYQIYSHLEVIFQNILVLQE